MRCALEYDGDHRRAMYSGSPPKTCIAVSSVSGPLLCSNGLGSHTSSTSTPISQLATAPTARSTAAIAGLPPLPLGSFASSLDKMKSVYRTLILVPFAACRPASIADLTRRRRPPWITSFPRPNVSAMDQTRKASEKSKRMPTESMKEGQL